MSGRVRVLVGVFSHCGGIATGQQVARTCPPLFVASRLRKRDKKKARHNGRAFAVAVRVNQNFTPRPTRIACWSTSALIAAPPKSKSLSPKSV